MKHQLKVLILIFAVFQGFAFSVKAQETDLLKKLKAEKKFEITKLEKNIFFEEAYEIMVTQPIDHKNPNGKTFRQRILLSHKSFSSPVIFITDGYSADYAASPTYLNELCKILNANQIFVEHRYFGKSIPEKIDWQYLMVEQSANDYHAIRELFKNIYPGKWISTGISKGGQTALSYRAYFQNDVDATVAYVAPINKEMEDKREEAFLNQVGTKECRDRIFAFQTDLLKNKNALMKPFTKYVEESNSAFTMKPDVTFDYLVLEYPFSFWQWCGVCDSIPSVNAGLQQKLYNLVNIVTPFYYTEKGIESFEAFFYQAYRELGYYNYDERLFPNLLTQNDYPNIALAPQQVKIDFKPETMKFVLDFLTTKAEKVIYIYGANDPWSASAVKPAKNLDALLIFKDGGCHTTRILNLPEEQRNLVYDKLANWLGIHVNRF